MLGFFNYLLLYNYWKSDRMRENISKLILIFGVSFLVINGIGYLFNITELITIKNNPIGGGGVSVSNIPTILSALMTCVILLVTKIRNKR